MACPRSPSHPLAFVLCHHSLLGGWAVTRQEDGLQVWEVQPQALSCPSALLGTHLALLSAYGAFYPSELGTSWEETFLLLSLTRLVQLRSFTTSMGKDTSPLLKLYIA